MFTFPFFGLYSFFPVAGILIGIIMVFAGTII